MKKIYLVLTLALLLVSCSSSPLYRTITVEIPEHPWEKYSNALIWYNLCWTDYTGQKELFVSDCERSISIKIPLGITVPICAYPIGEMQAFGYVVTPLDTQSTFYLNQNDGYIANILINLDSDSVKNLNYHKLREIILSQVTDFRLCDEIELMKDIMNGSLRKSSVKIINPVTVPSFAVTGGIWVSESVFDGRIIFIGNESSPMVLPVGIHRFINTEKNLELRIVVDEDGTIYHNEREPLVSVAK